MVTGYWNPTGQMVRNFSTNTSLNPGGWQGNNWEGRGYDIYSYMPNWSNSFKGDFEVDYQDTSADFWTYTNLTQPIAILSFGAGNGPWEVEHWAHNLGSGWASDGNSPYYPTPSPPDSSLASGEKRYSTLPMEAIASNVRNISGITGAWVDYTNNMGAYLCEYLGYHAMWYQSLHNNSGAADYCAAGGFIHTTTVSSPTTTQLNQFRNATEVTLRTLINALPVPVPETHSPIIIIAGFSAIACLVAVFARPAAAFTRPANSRDSSA
jgi:pyrrolidone-carboxylate peptidase